MDRARPSAWLPSRGKEPMGTAVRALRQGPRRVAMPSGRPPSGREHRSRYHRDGRPLCCALRPSPSATGRRALGAPVVELWRSGGRLWPLRLRARGEWASKLPAVSISAHRTARQSWRSTTAWSPTATTASAATATCCDRARRRKRHVLGPLPGIFVFPGSASAAVRSSARWATRPRPRRARALRVQDRGPPGRPDRAVRAQMNVHQVTSSVSEASS